MKLGKKKKKGSMDILHLASLNIICFAKVIQFYSFCIMVLIVILLAPSILPILCCSQLKFMTSTFWLPAKAQTNVPYVGPCLLQVQGNSLEALQR